MAAQLTIDRQYFEAMYSESPDPWDFDGSAYERRKFALTLAALPRQNYRRAFEPGCANGAFSELLAPRCDELICAELMSKVAARAAGRLSRFPDTSVYCKAIPQWWPTGTFDLMVLSEVLYYLTPAGMERAMSLIERSLDDGGHVVSVHYTLETNYPQSGEEVGERLRRAAWLKEIGRYRERAFELSVLERYS
ncbi:MAG: SAM-dependent methyltransferase [bacterium]